MARSERKDALDMLTDFANLRITFYNNFSIKLLSHYSIYSENSKD